MTSKAVLVRKIPKIIFQPFSVTSGMGQCDACSPVVFTKHEMPLSNLFNMPYSISPSLFKQPVDSTNFAILSPFTEAFSVLNESAMICLQHFDSPKTLKNIPSVWSKTWGKATVRSTLDQMVSFGLLVPKDYALQTKVCTPKEIPDTLAAWLHITGRCNLRCSYCYLPHNNTDMSLETGKAAIDATFRSAFTHSYREVKFKYAGGEPLLRFPFITELHRYARTLAEQYGLELDGVVLSNGTLLTNEMVREMQVLGLRLTISLDGLEERSQTGRMRYNVQRIYPDGRDAAGDAMRAVELALNCGLVPDISITVSGRNVEGLPELLEWVLERDLPFSLNFYRDPSTPLRVTGCDDLQLEKEKIVAEMLAAYKVIEANLPRRSLLASLADLANFAAPHLRRCSVGHSYLVFDCEGRVSKCQMQMDKPVTDIHAEDPLAIVREDKTGIQNLCVDEKEECLACQWRYWCAGGCPLETFRKTGRYDLKSPNCEIYKALYPEVLRLEGLRLLKYADAMEHG